MKIFVGNVDWQADETDLTELFENYGPVQDVQLPKGKITGEPRGFAFVTMDDQAAIEAIRKLNGSVFRGRLLTVNEARPKPRRQDKEL